jgi:hypothetical protein
MKGILLNTRLQLLLLLLLSGYMIAARLAQGLTGRPWLQLVRQLFPRLAPVFAASDTGVRAWSHRVWGFGIRFQGVGCWDLLLDWL